VVGARDGRLGQEPDRLALHDDGGDRGLPDVALQRLRIAAAGDDQEREYECGFLHGKLPLRNEDCKVPSGGKILHPAGTGGMTPSSTARYG
jgi:hypothetical protein